MFETCSAPIARAPVTNVNFSGFYSRALQCKIPDCGCKKAFASFFDSHSPAEPAPVIRKAATRNHMIASMTGKFACTDPNCTCHKVKGEYGDILYQSIYKMVYKLACRYSTTCTGDEISDLSQICHLRIMKKLHLFNSERGEFSTWTWRLCENTLRRHYKVFQRKSNFIDRMEEKHENVSKKENDKFLLDEMKVAVSELKNAHPEWAGTLDLMFGAGDEMPEKIVVTEIARRAGIAYNKVNHFYNTVVCPFFVERFQEKVSN